MSAQIIKISPSNNTINEFAQELIWLRDEVQNKSKDLIGLQGKEFKLAAIQSIYEIWEIGKKKKILKESEIPNLSFDEKNHVFEVSYKLTKFDFTSRMKIQIKKQWGVWGVSST